MQRKNCEWDEDQNWFWCHHLAAIHRFKDLFLLLKSEEKCKILQANEKPEFKNLFERLIVMQRVCHGVSSTYHNQQYSAKKADETKGNVTDLNDLIYVFLEPALKTIFYEKQWTTGKATGEETAGNLPLKTILRNLNNLPYLKEIPTTQSACLDSIHHYLRNIMASPSYDLEDKVLTLQVMLTVACKTGKLRHLLEFVEAALQVEVAEMQDVAVEIKSFIEVHFKSLGETASIDSLQPVSSCEAAIILLAKVGKAGEIHLKNLTQSCWTANIPVEIFVFGSQGKNSRTVFPTFITAFNNCEKVVGGDACTFVLQENGNLYGNLAKDDINLKTKINFQPQCQIKNLACSRALRNVGQTCAVTTDDKVIHLTNNPTTDQNIKLFQLPLPQKKIIWISTGIKHTAAVTDENELYTWGDGYFGQLGHGDNTSRIHPTKVDSIGPVSKVECGLCHTLALAQDGLKLWAFGNGCSGQLGFGENLNRQKSPREIDALTGQLIVKICCSSHSSIALTASGQVYSWGSGTALGLGNKFKLANAPVHIKIFDFIMDIACGSNHCLALTKDGQLLSWGQNDFGQCGLGHLDSPVTTPCKVIGLEQMFVTKIAAGNTHSIAAAAMGKVTLDIQKVISFDVHEKTFAQLTKLLVKYSAGLSATEPPRPFFNKESFEGFFLSCMKIITHQLTVIKDPDVLKKEKQDLWDLLFMIMDTQTTDHILEQTDIALQIGASFLMPSVYEIQDSLFNLLIMASNSWQLLTKGQNKMVRVMLTHLKKNTNVAVLLGLSSENSENGPAELQHIQIFLQLLLDDLVKHTELQLKEIDNTQTCDIYFFPMQDIENLLSTVQSHLISYVYCRPLSDKKCTVYAQFLMNHITYLINACCNIITLLHTVIEKFNESQKKQAEAILSDSPAGKMLLHIIHGISLLPLPLQMTLGSGILQLLSHITRLRQILQVDAHSETSVLQLNNEETDKQWELLNDMESSAVLVIESCCKTMIVERKKFHSSTWITSFHFDYGLKPSTQLNQILELLPGLVTAIEENQLDVLSNMIQIMTLNPEYTKFIYIAMLKKTDMNSKLLDLIEDFPTYNDMNLFKNSEKNLLQITTCFYLAAMLKHCNLSADILQDKQGHSAQLDSILKMVEQVHASLVSFFKKNHIQLKESEQCDPTFLFKNVCTKYMERAIIMLFTNQAEDNPDNTQESKEETTKDTDDRSSSSSSNEEAKIFHLDRMDISTTGHLIVCYENSSV